MFIWDCNTHFKFHFSLTIPYLALQNNRLIGEFCRGRKLNNFLPPQALLKWKVKKELFSPSTKITEEPNNNGSLWRETRCFSPKVPSENKMKNLSAFGGQVFHFVFKE
ncbi:MAG: hypothetical protein AAF806_19630 [Bacteroidota bacterium]